MSAILEGMTKKQFQKICDQIGATFSVINEYDIRFVEVVAPDGKQFSSSNSQTMVGYYFPEHGESVQTAYFELSMRIGFGIEELDPC